MSDRSDEVDDEDRLAAALTALVLTRGGEAVSADGDLARWRARRLASLRAERQ